VAAVFYLQQMETKALSQLIQLQGVWMRDIKPGNTGQRLL
jgi:hypothetical protein